MRWLNSTLRLGGIVALDDPVDADAGGRSGRGSVHQSAGDPASFGATFGAHAIRVDSMPVDAIPVHAILRRVCFANLDLSNPDTLEAIKEGQAPIPGQVKKAPAAPAGSNPNLGH